LSQLDTSARLPNSLSFSYHGKKHISEVIKESFLSKLESKKRETSHDQALTDRVSLTGSKNEPASDLTEQVFERVPCEYCKRLFIRERIEKHQRVCENNFKKNEFYKKTSPKPLKSNRSGHQQIQFHYPMSKWQKQHNNLINKLRLNEVSEDYEEYLTCPHCLRKFAPGPAEKHIKKCKDIIHRPKPPPSKVLPQLKNRNHSFIKERVREASSGKNSPRIEVQVSDGGITERVNYQEGVNLDHLTGFMKKVKIKHLTEPRSKSIYKMNNSVCKCGEVLPTRAVYCMMCGMCRYK
jgi:hypothetical protein